MRISRSVSRAGVTVLAGTLTLGACLPFASRNVATESGGDVSTGASSGPARYAPLPANRRAIPAGATFDVRLDAPLPVATTGARVAGTVHVALVARNGDVVIPAGARLEGRVASAGRDTVLVAFERVSFGRRTFAIEAEAALPTVGVAVRQAGATATDAGPPTVPLPHPLLAVRVTRGTSLRS